MLWTIVGNFFLLFALIYKSEKGDDLYHDIDTSREFNLLKTKPKDKEFKSVEEKEEEFNEEIKG